MKRTKTSVLLEWQKTGNKPLVLLGARQVGKTFLIRQFAQDAFQNHHYFNFEEQLGLSRVFEKSLKVQDMIFELELVANTKILETDLIIFDEIQAVPAAITSLKYFAEDKKYKVIAAGSLLGVKLNTASFPVGKVQIEHLSPMTFSEFLMNAHPFAFERYISISDSKQLHGALHDKLVEIYLHYLFVGGLPEAVLCYIDMANSGLERWQKVRQVQQNLIKSYQADFAKHSGSVNALHLASVWNDCARQIGQTQNDSVQRFRFQGVLPGKKQFSQFENVFHWLQKSSLIIKTYLVEKPEIPLSAYIKNSLFKAFIFDVGILNALLQISAETILAQDPNTTKGFIAENFLAQELFAQGFDILFSWEGKASQIEFLLEHQGKILPVEVKSGTRTRAKSLMAYCAQFDPHCKFIFSLQPYSKNGNLIKIPLYAPDRLGSVLQEAFASPKA